MVKKFQTIRDGLQWSVAAEGFLIKERDEMLKATLILMTLPICGWLFYRLPWAGADPSLLVIVAATLQITLATMLGSPQNSEKIVR